MGTEQVRHTSFIVTLFRGGGNGSDILLLPSPFLGHGEVGTEWVRHIHLLPSPFLGHGRGNWKLNLSDILNSFTTTFSRDRVIGNRKDKTSFFNHHSFRAMGGESGN